MCKLPRILHYENKRFEVVLGDNLANFGLTHKPQAGVWVGHFGMSKKKGEKKHLAPGGWGAAWQARSMAYL